MRNRVSSAIMRLHGPLTLRAVDRSTTFVGLSFIAFGFIMLWGFGAPRGGRVVAIAIVGGLAVLIKSAIDREYHRASLWAFAAMDEDPIGTLAEFEYLYRIPMRDVAAIARWRYECEQAGLDPRPRDDDPPQVRAMFEALDQFPREC